MSVRPGPRGLGCSAEGTCFLSCLGLLCGEGGGGSQTWLSIHTGGKCSPRLVVPTRLIGPIWYKVQEEGLFFTAIIDTNRDRVRMEPTSVEPVFPLQGAWCSLLRNLEVQGREWPPSKTGLPPAGRDRWDAGRPSPLYQRASVNEHPLELCSAQPEHLVIAFLA